MVNRLLIGLFTTVTFVLRCPRLQKPFRKYLGEGFTWILRIQFTPDLLPLFDRNDDLDNQPEWEVLK